MQGVILFPTMSSSRVKSLSEQCIDHIAMHLEDYPTSYLALLPLSLRKEILWALPMADVCKLEDTEFIKGINTEDYWSSTMDEEEIYHGTRFNHNIERYFEEQWSSGCAKKSIVCGMVFSLGVGFCNWDYSGFGFEANHYRLQNAPNISWDRLMAIGLSLSLMFGVRRCLYWKERVRQSSAVIPSQYQQYTTSCDSKAKLLRAVIECFQGYPLTYLFIWAGVIEETECGGLSNYIAYCKNLLYLELLFHQTFGPKLEELMLKITREAANLEVLVLNYEPPCDDINDIAEPLQSIDGVISELTDGSFVSSMHMLVTYTCFSQQSLDMERGYFSVSYAILKRFIDKFLVTQCDHRQLLSFEGTDVACNNLQELRELILYTDYPPEKAIEFSQCKFSITKSISAKDGLLNM